MLDSVKISRRQSEIRQSLAELVAKPEPSEDETRSMENLDAEYRTNETRYRAALTAEDTERREAGADLETRESREWDGLLSSYEVRQAVLALTEGRALEGATAEVVEEMRSRGGFQGIPLPIEALETRAGETVSGDTPAPRVTAPTVDRLFAQSVFTRMGGQTVAIPFGEREYPVATAGAQPGWAGAELGPVPGPQPYQTDERTLQPNHTLGCVMKISRKALLQSGSGLEQAIRRDMGQAVRVELDRASFQGTGTGGEPLGIVAGAAAYGIESTAIDAAASWAAFRTAAVAFMLRSAADGLGGINALTRPELMDALDAALFDAGSGITEWDRLTAKLGQVLMTPNALAALFGDPAACSALLSTSTGGVPPAMMGVWSGIDLIRDQFTDAASGQLRLVALTTVDVAVLRPAQLQVLSGLEV